MQKEAREAMWRFQNAEEKAKKTAAEVGALTACSLLPSRADWSSSHWWEATLQPKRIPLILQTARRRLAHLSALGSHFEELGQLTPPLQPP